MAFDGGGNERWAYEWSRRGNVSFHQAQRVWLVEPDDFESIRHKISRVLGLYICQCRAFRNSRAKPKTCKHTLAVRFFKGELDETALPQEPPERPPATRRDWALYNRVSTTIGPPTARILAELASLVDDAPQHRGRPSLSFSQLFLTTAFQISSQKSGRTYRSAIDLGMIDENEAARETLPHFNTTSKFLRHAALTPILRKMIQEVAAPLAALENVISVDSTGILTSNRSVCFERKYGNTKVRDTIKLHIATGRWTHVITDAVVTPAAGKNSGDVRNLIPVLKGTLLHFKPTDVLADAIYGARYNFDAIAAAGAEPRIKFKDNASGKGSPVVERCFHFFKFHKEDFFKIYHLRANAESSMSMFKRIFGGSVFSRTLTGQVNELYFKALLHNIRRLLFAAETHDITAQLFKDETGSNSKGAAVANFGTYKRHR